jgi:hypothetical protein
MFENIAEEVFCSKRLKVTGEYRKSHNESLHKLYFPQNIMGKKNK